MASREDVTTGEVGRKEERMVERRCEKWALLDEVKCVMGIRKEQIKEQYQKGKQQDVAEEALINVIV